MNDLFYVSAAVAILSTVMVITKLNAVHALLYLIISLLAIALVFYSLGAPFVAALEVIIYAGAIMVLFVFVIMMLNLGPGSAEQEKWMLSPGMWIGPVVLVIILMAELVYALARSALRMPGIAMVGPRQVGSALFGPYLIGVELASMLLLAGLVGAFHLGRRDKQQAMGEGR